MEKQKICCKGNGAGIPARKYDGDWFCKNPERKSLVLTSTMYGARPNGCPKIDLWNKKEHT